MELTLFELHLDDASFAANAPFSGSSEESADVFEDDEHADEGSGGPSPVAFVVGLAFLVGIGLAVRRLVGGSDSPDEAIGDATSEPVTA